MDNLSQIRLSYYYVAFIDILGFSNMVETDCNGPPNKVSFLPKLITLHKTVSKNKDQAEGSSVMQFSDSIVLAHPLLHNEFPKFASWVAKFQHSLFLEGVLSRGGISYGKHYQHESFLFSEALIKAYRIENKQATYPRIVIDDDLLDLLKPSGVIPSNTIIHEADGAYFLHYLCFGNIENNSKAIKSLTIDWEKQPTRVREKLRWLRDYFSFCFPQNPDFQVTRFKLMQYDV